MSARMGSPAARASSSSASMRRMRSVSDCSASANPSRAANTARRADGRAQVRSCRPPLTATFRSTAAPGGAPIRSPRPAAIASWPGAPWRHRTRPGVMAVPRTGAGAGRNRACCESGGGRGEPAPSTRDRCGTAPAAHLWRTIRVSPRAPARARARRHGPAGPRRQRCRRWSSRARAPNPEHGPRSPRRR